MKFYGRLRGDNKNKWLNFGGYPDHDPALAEICTPRVLRLVYYILMPSQLMFRVHGYARNHMAFTRVHCKANNYSASLQSFSASMIVSPSALVCVLEV